MENTQHSLVLSEDEIQDIVWQWECVDKQYLFQRRWGWDVLGVFKHPENGKLYSITWFEGATETQEDMYDENDTAEEVTRAVTTKQIYIPVANLADRDKRDAETIMGSLDAVGEAVDDGIRQQALQQLYDVDVDQLFEVMSGLDKLAECSDFASDHITAFRGFLSSIKHIQSQRQQ